MEIEVVLEQLHPAFSYITVSILTPSQSIAKKYVVRADLRPWRPSSRSLEHWQV